jgi:hypothetical protein
MVPAKPTLHLLALSGMTPEERVRILADLFERLTGRKPTPDELEEQLRAARAAPHRRAG